MREVLNSVVTFTGLTPPYSTLVVDPPWHYDSAPVAITGEVRRPLSYSTMTTEEIADLPVATLAAPGAHLFLWTTDRHLWGAPTLLDMWGFRIAKLLVWAKPPAGYMMSGPFTNTTEFVVYARRPTDVGGPIRAARKAAGMTTKQLHAAVRGGVFTGLVSQWEANASVPNETDWRLLQSVLPDLADTPQPLALPPIGRVDSTWWEWPRGRHSEKPAAFLDIVERVSPGPYVELFARAPRLGWDSWGYGYESERAS